MSTIVRPATREDIPRIVDMALRFYPTTHYAKIADVTKESAAGLAIIAMESGVMLVAEKDGAVIGMACLVVGPFEFNVSVTMATELAWWIEPEHRGSTLALRMMEAIHAAARERGASVVRMATMANSPPQAAAMYERLGYVHSDSHYMKVL